MLESLSEKLNLVFKKLGSKGRLTEKDIDDALREVRMALLGSDVNYKVAKNFVESIRERSLNSDVLKSLSPGQQVVKITNEVLTEILGGGVRGLISDVDPPSVAVMVGLNGSGKTTTSAKLAWTLKKSGQVPVLVAADLYRPAAIQQLEVLGEKVGVDVYRGDVSSNCVDVAKEGVAQASKSKAAWAIVDTAGRFQIDSDLMGELREICEAIKPSEKILVVDSMTGQEAVEVAKEFHSDIGLTGLILTKMDGDSRGGAALSIVSGTGVPIKYIGTGEKVEDIQQFFPDRLASRILGMGDMLTLIEKTQATFEEGQAASLEKKIIDATFDLNDFLSQLRQLKKMGPLSQITDMIPGMASLKGRISTDGLEEDKIKIVEAVIQSMTPEERRKPDIIGGRRRKRIANGSGTTVRDVNQLLNQFKQMQKMMKQLTSGKTMTGLGRFLR